ARRELSPATEPSVNQAPAYGPLADRDTSRNSPCRSPRRLVAVPPRKMLRTIGRRQPRLSLVSLPFPGERSLAETAQLDGSLHRVLALHGALVGGVDLVALHVAGE